MKRTIMVIAIGCICMVFMLAANTCAGDSGWYYEQYLSGKIDSCLAKTERFHDSKSSQLRMDAALSLQKASYLVCFKDRIVEELNTRPDILKPHQIDVFVNKKFGKVSRSNLLATSTVE
jgi:hypothetical protein